MRNQMPWPRPRPPFSPPPRYSKKRILSLHRPSFALLLCICVFTPTYSLDFSLLWTHALDPFTFLFYLRFHVDAQCIICCLSVCFIRCIGCIVVFRPYFGYFFLLLVTQRYA
ncbi:MAG: hypothetical protein J3R72DRAFT_434013 [Linnemannia gamsii]|nr:MAG: hypothetical protein J3R72DRAFT_434013 [Linnemannia gamsii]